LAREILRARKNIIFAPIFGSKIGCFWLNVALKKQLFRRTLFKPFRTPHLVSLASDPMSPAGRDFLESEV